MCDLELKHLIGKARLLRREGKTYDEIRALIGPIGDDALRAWMKGIPRPPETNRSGRGLPEVRRKARQLRAQGMTYKEIGQLTGASVGSLNLWLADMPLDHFAPPERRRRRFQETCARSRERRLLEREALFDRIAGSVGPITDRELFFAGLALYWAEGAKSKEWRVSDRVTFINSDPAVIRIFMQWLDLLGVEQSRLGLRLSIHESADLVAAHLHWAEVIGIGADRFSRPTLKRHNPKTVRHNTGVSYFGCVVIDVRQSAALYRSIEGWWRGLTIATRMPRSTGADLDADPPWGNWQPGTLWRSSNPGSSPGGGATAGSLGSEEEVVPPSLESP